jgi:hypothetical protein
MHLEGPYAHYPMDAEHMHNMIINFRTRDKVIFLLRDGELLAGYLAAAASPHPFFQFLTASEYGWYVLPEYRKEASWSLIDAYEQWAETIGCKATTLTNYNTPKLSEAYEARGYKLYEQSFIKELV